MHFVCSTFGSAGDVFPMLGLALALRDRGHEVTFATNQHYAAVCESHGVPFQALGTEAEFAACISHPDLWHPRRAFPHIFRCFQAALGRQYQMLAERAGSPDLVAITNLFGFGALVAQDKHHVPVITLHCQPAPLWSDREPPVLGGMIGPRWLRSLQFRLAERFVIDRTVCPFLNSWRHELALPPVRNIVRWWNSRGGVLCMFPEWFAPPPGDWPTPLVQTDFPLWNHGGGEPLTAEVEAFLQGGDPPVAFTPGSANLHGEKFFAAAVQACQQLGRRAILLTEFPQQIPRHLPETAKHFEYVPLDALLPRTAAFVHHGGVGSMSQAMRAGIPQVLMPLAHDQFDNAARVRRLGAGDWLPVHRFTGKRLAKMLRAVLASSAAGDASRELARRLKGEDGLRQSAVAVEQLVAMGGQARSERKG